MVITFLAYVQTGLWGAVRLRTFAGALLSHVTVVQQPQSGNEAVSHPSALEFAKADLQIDGSALFDVAAVLQLPLGSAGAGVLEIALDDAPAATRVYSSPPPFLSLSLCFWGLNFDF